MIYTNFLIFIVAIFLFLIAPATLKTSGGALGIALLLLGFWQFNRYKFIKLRANLENDRITIGEAKKRYLSTTNLHMIFAIFVFAAEAFIFDLKYFLVHIPMLGELDIFVNAAGVGFFILHLSMIWFWGFRTMGDVVSIGKSASHHVKANIKFNLVIVVPWLILSLLIDVIEAFSPPSLISLLGYPLAQMTLFGFVIVVIAIFAPLFITWLWDCKPLDETDAEMKGTIDAFCRSQGVKFKRIMSWNALNGGLVTAGVLGLISSFRYLMITPELMKLLDKDELLGVVSHEVGHVKKKHLLFYLLFFLAFMFIYVSIFQLASQLILKNPFGWDITIRDRSIVIDTPPEFFIIFIFLFIIYFRFIFGYFIRNFEREADIFCFHAGVNPGLLVSSFHKLEEHMGGEGQKSNWHHYTIAQRVGFLKTCMDNPDRISTHEKKVKRSLRLFMISMVIVVTFVSYMFVTTPPTSLDLGVQIAIVEALKKKIEQDPGNPDYYTALGDYSYSLEKWEEAKEAYENSIRLKYQQAYVLNNLAWLLLKCPDKRLLDPRRALKLAQDAVALDKAFYILDTLAEAYFQNSMYKEAYHAARQAYLTAPERRDYFKKQLEKMEKYYKKFKSAVTI
ncbi:MAG: M48 family metalloprotease [Candidatus Aminicenantes bacterium]|nr:MAG: M48 family metalloprotease [Candidatus Aminicenantes bacterium]